MQIFSPTSRNALITGASRRLGLGFAVARQLAERNYRVLLAARTLATALADTPILINAVDPGPVASHPERGDDENDRSPAEAAKGVVWAAPLEPGGPTGGLFYDGEPAAETVL